MAGLLNIGNTCYLNSIIQCLYAIDPFQTRLIRGDLLYNIAVNIIDNNPTLLKQDEPKIKQLLKAKLKDSITYQLYRLFTQMRKKQDKATIFPDSFKNVIGAKCSFEDVDDQNDTHEMLSFLLDNLEKEMKHPVSMTFHAINPDVQKYVDFEASCNQRIAHENCPQRKTKISQILKQYKQLNQQAVHAANASSLFKDYIETNHSIVSDLFMGQLCSKLTSTDCGNTSCTFEPLFIVSLPIPFNGDKGGASHQDASFQPDESDAAEDSDGTSGSSDDSDGNSDAAETFPMNNPVSESDSDDDGSVQQHELYSELNGVSQIKIPIQDCLDEYIKTETLSIDDQWFCDQCTTKVPSQKSLQIWKAPPVLIIHLNRFHNSLVACVKNRSYIDFPIEGLDLTKYVHQYSPNSDGTLIYDLVAVNNHYGTMHNGHYDSFCKHDNKWIHYNDETVESIEPESVVTLSAYILFYKQRVVSREYSTQHIDTCGT